MMAFGLTPGDWYALPYWERRYLAEWYAGYQQRMNQGTLQGQPQMSPEQATEMAKQFQ